MTIFTFYFAFRTVFKLYLVYAGFHRLLIPSQVNHFLVVLLMSYLSGNFFLQLFHPNIMKMSVADVFALRVWGDMFLFVQTISYWHLQRYIKEKNCYGNGVIENTKNLIQSARIDEFDLMNVLNKHKFEIITLWYCCQFRFVSVDQCNLILQLHTRRK